MEKTMETFGTSMGVGLPRARDSRQRYDVLVRALSGLGFAAIWGLAAGSAAPALAVANIYKVPMVLALSAVVALPAALVTRHLLRVPITPFELCSALVTSLYRASLLLLGFAPLLGVYAYTSQSVAPLLAQGSALMALMCGVVSLRSELARLSAPRSQLWLLGAVVATTLALSLLQLVSLATPVLTMPTVFGGGIDGLLR
jgi:hypothetical protein